MVTTCHRTWLSLDGKGDCNSLENNKSGWPWWSLHAIRLDCLWIVNETVIVSVWWHWSLQKGEDDHNLSLHANELDCLWRENETLIVSIERNWSLQKEADDHNLSLHADGLDCLWKAKKTLIVLIERHWSLSKVADDHDCLYMQQTWLSLEGKGDFNSLGRKTLKSLKRGRWPWLSLHANRLDCLWKAKDTLIVSVKHKWQRTLSPMKDKGRGLWVLWKIKMRNLSLMKDKVRTLSPMKKTNRCVLVPKGSTLWESKRLNLWEGLSSQTQKIRFGKLVYKEKFMHLWTWFLGCRCMQPLSWNVANAKWFWTRKIV